MTAFNVFQPGTSYTASFPATGTTTVTLSPGCRYVRIAGTSPALVQFGNATGGMLTGAAYYPDYFSCAGVSLLTIGSANGLTGKLYITEMSN